MAKKILGIDNLDVIRDFVLSKLTSESDELRRELTEENAKYLQQKIVEASASLKTDYESKYNSLSAQLDNLKTEGADADKIRELELQLDALQNNYADQQNSLSSIEDSLMDIESSVMSPGQLNELVNTALIEKTTITDDMVETPNVYTKNLVALIAKFGTVRALNIIGDEIEGKTIKSVNGKWSIGKDGDGSLANGNISWDKNGNVTFGENVIIGWGAIKDAVEEKLPEGGVSLDQVESKIATQLSQYEVKSEQLTGKTITGATIQSSGDAWKLNKEGDGQLANGNISWDKDGNVTFGENVTIGWGAIEDAVNNNVSTGGGSGDGLTTSDVNALITTKLDKYEIKSEQLTGKTITGATIQSSDDAWKIGKDGDGWLANHNISWNSVGDLEVKGKLLGQLGNGTDDLYLDGTLAIVDDTDGVTGQVLTALSGESRAYETYLDEDDVEHKRFVTLATGFPAGVTDVTGDITIYRWVIKADSIDPNYNTLFTVNLYDDFKNGDIIESVYYYNGSKGKYMLADGEYKLYSGQIKKTGINTYGWCSDKYIQSTTSKAKFVFNEAIVVNNSVFNILQTAKTKIYSDGAIVTDNLHAERGFFGGTINAKGEFTGRLNECNGSVTNCRITNSIISDSAINIKNYNTFTASRSAAETSKNAGTNEVLFSITPKETLSNNITPISYWWNKYSAYKQNRGKKDIVFKTNTKKGNTIFKFEVNKGDTVTIPSFYVSASVYQPRKKDITDKTKPCVGIFIKTPDGYKTILNGQYLIRDDKSAKYNKHQYTYGYTTQQQQFTALNGGTWEIQFGYDVVLANKQCFDYAACTFNLDVAKGTTNINRCIYVKPSSNDSNTMKIGANGIQIITKFGHKLTTTDGYIKMVSANGKYGLQVDDKGVKILKPDGWKYL